METHPTALADVVELVPQRHGDDRGWFSEVWNRRTHEAAEIDIEWVQDNESLSGPVGTLRGIHYQSAPHAQDKLVRVLAGSLIDIAVDLRRSSATFGQHVAVELTAARGNQLLIPVGFGHAFFTLEPNCRVAYKVSAFYVPANDHSIVWDDPDLAIDWPTIATPVLSPKDLSAPTLKQATGDLFE